jgi:hypothetical protein
MDAENLIELEMGTRVVAFSKANPSDNPGQEAAVAKLDEKVARAKALVNQGATGHLTVHASVLTKDEVRDALTVKIRLLQGVARAAAVEVPGVGARIRLRNGRPGNTAFLASAQLALAQATEFQELFTKYGMPAGFLEEFGALVKEFEASLDEKDAGLRTHVGANAELDATMSDIMMLVKQLDAINRHRFRKDAERLAAWKSARNVHWPDAPKAPKGKKPGSEGAA